MYLPSEIIVQALRDVPKDSLKAARLMNRQWSSCAAELLFDTVYISPHKINIDVFQSITQHPVLRSYVTNLVYDGVRFPTVLTGWTYSQYFRMTFDRAMNMKDWPQEILEHPDDQINEFVELARWTLHSEYYERRSEAQEQCSEFGFIRAGYRKWQEHALYEQDCLENDNFIRILTMGLGKLDRLKNVELKDNWREIGSMFHADGRHSGSPLARSWGILNPDPLDWNWDHSLLRGLVYPPGSPEFWNVAVALSKSEKRINSFELSGFTPIVMFDTQSIATEERLRQAVGAFAQLKVLRPKSSYGSLDPVSDDLHGLRIMLDRMRDLEVLELCLPQFGISEDLEWSTYESIFPKDGAWRQLKTFTIVNFKIRDMELLQLLFSRLPSLQHLKLGDMWLLADGQPILGTEAQNTILSETSFFHMVEDEETGGAEEWFLDSLEKYIIHGAHDWTIRHSSLEDSQPTQDSLDYLNGMIDRGSEITHLLDIDVALLKEHVAKVCAEAHARREVSEITEGISSTDIHCNSWDE